MPTVKRYIVLNNDPEGVIVWEPYGTQDSANKASIPISDTESYRVEEIVLPYESGVHRYCRAVKTRIKTNDLVNMVALIGALVSLAILFSFVITYFAGGRNWEEVFGITSLVTTTWVAAWITGTLGDAWFHMESKNSSIRKSFQEFPPPESTRNNTFI